MTRYLTSGLESKTTHVSLLARQINILSSLETTATSMSRNCCPFSEEFENRY